MVSNNIIHVGINIKKMFYLSYQKSNSSLNCFQQNTNKNL